jgi:GTP-sensing pleiotropic transcriptional regulator CodY
LSYKKIVVIIKRQMSLLRTNYEEDKEIKKKKKSLAKQRKPREQTHNTVNSHQLVARFVSGEKLTSFPHGMNIHTTMSTLLGIKLQKLQKNVQHTKATHARCHIYLHYKKSL